MGTGIKAAIGILGLVTICFLWSGPKLIAQYIQTPDSLIAIRQPLVADSAWAFVQKCSKILELPPQDLAKVKWFKSKLTHTQQEAVFGEWVAPDTVILDDRLMERFEVVAHELLHYLIHIQEIHAEQHPFIPFYAPCRLMPSQQSTFDDDGILTWLSDSTKLYPRTNH